MNTQSAIVLISEVEIVKVVVRLSLKRVNINTPLLECLWPRVTFICNGVEKTFPFTYWRRFRDAGMTIARDGRLPHDKQDENSMADIAFLAATLRPCVRPFVLSDAAAAKGKLLYKKIYARIVTATKKQSFINRHAVYMRKLERAEGKKKLRQLLLALPHRLEKRDVIEAWQEAIVEKVQEA